jgi:hypothetical protein
LSALCRALSVIRRREMSMFTSCTKHCSGALSAPKKFDGHRPPLQFARISFEF